MSELIATNTTQKDFRKHLLITVSALAVTSLAATAQVHASDSERPTVWVELGGQMDFTQGASSPIVADFMANNANVGAFDPVSALDAQKSPRFSFGEEAKISIQPKHSDWVFSASLRYGRVNSKRYIHQQTAGFPIPSTAPMYTGHVNGIPQHRMALASYAEFKETQSESHFALDFQAGKDVGLGLFGNDSSSVVSIGVRMARISSSAEAKQRMRLDVHGSHFTSLVKYHRFYNHYSLTGYSNRSFRGIGPSLSWSGSASVVGNTDAGQLGVDWSANAALLFGRQKMKAHHHTTGVHRSILGLQGNFYNSPYETSKSPARSRSVVIPNIGGSFALAYRFDNAKLDVGYRADLYLHAMDTGFDTRQTSNVLYHGPFAKLSIGLGG